MLVRLLAVTPTSPSAGGGHSHTVTLDARIAGAQGSHIERVRQRVEGRHWSDLNPAVGGQI